MKSARLTDADVREAGWNALVDRLGLTGALRFAMQTEKGRGDYAADRHRMLGGRSVDELVREMRASVQPRRRRRRGRN